MLGKHKLTLTRKTRLTEKVYLLSFSIDNDLVFKAGQYLIVDVPRDNEIVKRIYSIASSPKNKKELELIIEVVQNGVGSNYLVNLDLGDKINVQAPAGVFTLQKPLPNNIVFVVTGTGIAPVRSMIDHLLENKAQTKILLLWGLRYRDDVYLREEFQLKTLKNPNFSYYYCLSRETKQLTNKDFKQHRVDKCVNNLIKNGDKQLLSKVYFYVCGGRDAVVSLKNLIHSLGVGEKRVTSERF